MTPSNAASPSKTSRRSGIRTAPAKKPRIRLTPEERIEQIVTVSTSLVAQNGFYGLSLQSVADGVGITQAGLLHYIGNKEGLLELLLDKRYDRQGTPSDYIATGAPSAVHPDGVSLPGYIRFIVDFNARRPQLMQLYMVLGTEAADKNHPAHAYFRNRPDDVWNFYQETTWRLPPSIVEAGGFATLRPLIEMALEAMDGAQVRIWRFPAVDLRDEWARFDELLFPSPLWDGYR